MFLWIGYGLQGVVAVSFIISLFPIIANTTAGLIAGGPATPRSFCDEQRQSLARAIQAARAQCGSQYAYRSSNSSGLSVIGAIVGEFFAGYGTDDFGLGYLIIQISDRQKTDYLFVRIRFTATDCHFQRSGPSKATDFLLPLGKRIDQLKCLEIASSHLPSL